MWEASAVAMIELAAVDLPGGEALADWRTGAACVGVDPRLFFPEQWEPMAPAKRICAEPRRVQVRSDPVSEQASQPEASAELVGLHRRPEVGLTDLERLGDLGHGVATVAGIPHLVHQLHRHLPNLDSVIDRTKSGPGRHHQGSPAPAHRPPAQLTQPTPDPVLLRHSLLEALLGHRAAGASDDDAASKSSVACWTPLPPAISG